MRTVGITGTTAAWAKLARTTGGDQLDWLNTEARTTLLRQGQQASIVQAVPQEEAVYVVQLKQVHQPTLTAADLQEGQRQQMLQMGNELAGEFMNARLAKLDITYNLPLLQRVFGDGFTAAHFPVAKTEQAY